MRNHLKRAALAAALAAVLITPWALQKNHAQPQDQPVDWYTMPSMNLGMLTCTRAADLAKSDPTFDFMASPQKLVDRLTEVGRPPTTETRRFSDGSTLMVIITHDVGVSVYFPRESVCEDVARQLRTNMTVKTDKELR
jgi:hypothetical protein